MFTIEGFHCTCISTDPLHVYTITISMHGTPIMQVSVEDIAQMKTKTLYQFKVSGFEDAKLIVDTAKKHCQVQPQDEVSKATASEQGKALS